MPKERQTIMYAGSGNKPSKPNRIAMIAWTVLLLLLVLGLILGVIAIWDYLAGPNF